MNALLRASVADVCAQVDRDTSKREEILNGSNLGVIVKRSSEASLAIGLATVVALVVCDAQRIYTTYLAIVAQSIQASLGGVPFNFLPEESLIVDFVSYQADSLWSIRQMVVDGSLTTPLLAKLLYVVQKGTKTSSRTDRVSLDNCIGHVCNVLKVPSTQQGKNHILGAIFEVSIMRCLRDATVSPELMGAAWHHSLREPMLDSISMKYFSGRRNRQLETQIRSTATLDLAPFAANAINRGGNYAAGPVVNGVETRIAFNLATGDLSDEVCHRMLVMLQSATSASTAPSK
eukprot:548377-Amphidinium_carterae.1